MRRDLPTQPPVLPPAGGAPFEPEEVSPPAPAPQPQGLDPDLILDRAFTGRSLGLHLALAEINGKRPRTPAPASRQAQPGNPTPQAAPDAYDPVLDGDLNGDPDPVLDVDGFDPVLDTPEGPTVPDNGAHAPALFNRPQDAAKTAGGAVDATTDPSGAPTAPSAAPVLDHTPRFQGEGSLYQPGAQDAGNPFQGIIDAIFPHPKTAPGVDLSKPVKTVTGNPDGSSDYVFQDGTKAHLTAQEIEQYSRRAQVDKMGQNAPRVAGQAFKAGVQPLLTAVDLLNSAKNAGVNEYVKYIDEHAGAEGKDVFDLFGGAVDRAFAASKQNFTNNAQSFSPAGRAPYQQVSLRDFWKRVAPELHLQDVGVIPTLSTFTEAGKQVRAGAKPEAVAARVAASTVNPYGFLVGAERFLRNAGFTAAADQTRDSLHELTGPQVDALKHSFVRLDQVADFATDIATDPLQVVEAGGQIIKKALVRTVPGLVTAEGLAKTLEPAARAGSPVPAFFHRLLENRMAAKFTKGAIQEGEVKIAQSVDKVVSYTRELRAVQDAAAVKYDRKVAGDLDRWVWEYADANSAASPYKGKTLSEARQQVLNSAAGEGVPPDLVTQIQRLGDAGTALEEEFGKTMVKYKALHPESFQALRGNHIRYLYSQGAYDSESIFRTLANKDGYLFDKGLVKRRQDLDRATQEALDLNQSAILGFGLGGTKEAKATGVLAIQDNIRKSPWAMKDPFIREPGIAKVTAPEQYVPGFLRTDAGEVKDLATIGDTVEYTPQLNSSGGAPGGKITGQIVDVKLQPDKSGVAAFVIRDGEGVDHEIGTLQRIGEDGKLVKTEGPYRAVEGEPIPGEVLPSRRKPKLADREPLPQGDLRDEAQKRYAKADAENRLAEVANERLKLEGADQNAAEIAQNNQIIRRNNAAKRYYAKVTLTGDLPVRPLEEIHADVSQVVAASKKENQALKTIDARIKSLDNAGVPATRNPERSRLLRMRKSHQAVLDGLENQIDDLRLEKEMQGAQSPLMTEPQGPPGPSPFEAAEATRLETAQEAAKQIPPGWVRLPEDAKWGPLQGHYVNPEVKKLLENRYGDKMLDLGQFGAASRRMVSYIKYVKTALNPATHANNWVGNFMLAETGANLHGTSILSQPWLLANAAQELKAGSGRYLDELRRSSTALETTSDAVGEILGQRAAVSPLPQTALQDLSERARNVFNAPGHAYQGAEQLWKLTLFSAYRKQGMSAVEAANLTQRYLFDYSDVPQIVEVARRYGLAPFITFPYKATGVLLETAAKKPSLLNRYNILQGHAQQAIQDAQDQYPELIAGKPYLKDRPVLPIGKDSKGNVVYVDMTNKIPWGFVAGQTPQSTNLDVKEFSPEGMASNSFAFGLPSGTMLREGIPNPLGFINPAFKSPLTTGFNNHPILGGRDILGEGQPPQRQWETQASDTVQTYLSPFGAPFAPYPLVQPRVGGLNIAPSADRVEHGLSNQMGATPVPYSQSQSMYSAEQSAWGAVAQTVFGLATHVRQGIAAPDTKALLQERGKNSAKEIQQDQALKELQGVLQQAVKEPKLEDRIINQYPNLAKITAYPQIDQMSKASEKEMQSILFDYSISPRERTDRLRRQMLYTWAIARRAAQLQRQGY